MENLTSNKRAIDELMRGREWVNQLQKVLNKSESEGNDGFAEDLVGKIMATFTNTLLALTTTTPDCSSSQPDQVSQMPKCEEESEVISCKTSNRRGCSKRRKNETEQSWMTETTTLVDDGHAWRKYGQKAILRAQYPRSYFRCTHKNEQGCLATKQVQRIQADPPKYRITYYGHHTCQNFLKPPAIILEDPLTPADSSSVLLSFRIPNSTTIQNQQCSPNLSSFDPSIKKENNEEINTPPSNDHEHQICQNQSSSSSSSYDLISFVDDMTPFVSSRGHSAMQSSTLESDDVDTYLSDVLLFS